MKSVKRMGLYIMVCFLVVSSSLISLVGCTGKNGIVSFERPIKEPVSAAYSGQATTVGSLATSQVLVQIPAGALSADVKTVTLTNPANVPGMSGDEASLIAAPVEVSVGADKTVRLDQLVTMTLKFDPAKLPFPQ